MYMKRTPCIKTVPMNVKECSSPIDKGTSSIATDFINGNPFLELSGALGNWNSQERLSKLEDKVWPMYDAIPKDKDGGLNHGSGIVSLPSQMVGM